MAANNEPKQWTDLLIGLYDNLNEKDAVINYNFKNLEVDVPEGVESDRYAHWKINGEISINTTKAS